MSCGTPLLQNAKGLAHNKCETIFIVPICSACDWLARHDTPSSCISVGTPLSRQERSRAAPPPLTHSSLLSRTKNHTSPSSTIFILPGGPFRPCCYVPRASRRAPTRVGAITELRRQRVQQVLYVRGVRSARVQKEGFAPSSLVLWIRGKPTTTRCLPFHYMQQQFAARRAPSRVRFVSFTPQTREHVKAWSSTRTQRVKYLFRLRGTP